MIRIKPILEGWANVIKDRFNALDPEIKELSEERLLQCQTCTLRANNTCSTQMAGAHVKTGELTRGCGCNIAAKSLVAEPACPLGKWDK
jgi:hypothetical protein